MKYKRDFLPDETWRDRLLVIWSEDDAGTYDRERPDQAFDRLSGLRGAAALPIETLDEGDCFVKLYQEGWVVMHMPEGGCIAVVIKPIN